MAYHAIYGDGEPLNFSSINIATWTVQVSQWYKNIRNNAVEKAIASGQYMYHDVSNSDKDTYKSQGKMINAPYDIDSDIYYAFGAVSWTIDLDKM